VPKQTDLAYLAGIIDGEGWVGIKRGKAYACQGRKSPSYNAGIQVRMVDEGAIRFLAEKLGGWYYKEKPHCNNGRPLFCYQASDRAAEGILKKLRPFLRVKARQCDVVLRLRTLQASGHKHRTRKTGTRSFRHWTGKVIRLPNLAFSEAYLSALDSLWMECRRLNGLARFFQK